jgi:hypothetical protein
MAEYVDPINFKSNYDYNVALNEADRKSAQAEIDAAKAKGVDLLNPEGGVLNDTTGNSIRLRSMLQGIHNSDDQQNAATFYGLTPENYQNVLSGDMTRPMGENQSVYGAQLLSPLQRIAAETARGQGIGEPNARVMELAKANPDVFNAASQKYQNYFTNTYPGTLEYESVLSGPMQFSGAGVKYPEIKDTASMYILNPRTNQLVKNPNYKSPIRKADGGLMGMADHMASKGRNGDSMLVHMTPSEVHGLQALALKHGGSLTVNPDTGLPEANFLKSILPILAGLALGPAGMGIAFGGLSSAASAGLLVGGVTGLATGSLSKGLMAGLGAYGGAGLGGSLASAGEGVLSSQITGELAKEKAAEIAAGQLGEEEIGKMASQRLADASMTSKLGAGLGAITDSGSAAMNFAKQNMLPLGAAAAPILADQMVPTTTKAAPPVNPGMIRQKIWDGRQFVDVGPVAADKFGNRSFSDIFKGYNEGGSTDSRGIVALAEGGVPGYAGGDVVGGYKPSDTEIFNYFKTPGLDDAKIAQDMQKYGVSAADIARATGTQGQQGNYEQRFVQAVATPATDAGEFMAATKAVGLQNQGLATALQNSGLSAADQYALTHNLSDATTNLGALKDTSFYKNLGYTTGTAPGDQGGLEGLYSNINNAASGLQKQINAGTLTVAEAQRLADAEMARVGVSQKDIKAATGQDLFSLFTPKTVIDKKIDTIVGATGNDTLKGGTGNDTLVTTPAIVCPTGFHYDPVAKACVPNISATQPTTTTVTTPTDLYTAPATSLPVGVSGNTGASQIGGGATVNPNGTITTSPRIPGIPVGGFTGMQNLRDTYTKGGGSLGYTSPTFKTIEDFNAKYVNRMSGDSRAAYDYLTGKAGAAYPTKSGVGQISQDYATAVLGYPARGNLPYIYNKTTGRMDVNPDYVAPGRDSSGNVTYSMSLNDIKSTLKDTPLSGQALYDWAQSNNLSAQQIADATGRTLSSVYADFRAGSKSKTEADKKKADEAAAAGNTSSESSSGTGGEAAGGLQQAYAMGGMPYSGGGLGTLGGYSDGGRLLKGPGDGVSDSIPATIGRKQQPARLADGEFVVPARIVSELGNGSTDAGAKKLYAMMDRVQRARGKTTGKNKVAANSRADKYLPA